LEQIKLNDMGINISLYRILSIEKEETWGGRMEDYCKTAIFLCAGKKYGYNPLGVL